MSQGTLALVLHAHLPFVRHPEHQFHLEETWLYEAITATYLPLLEVFTGLARDGVDFRLTLSMSPPLCAMLTDELLRSRARAFLDRLLALGEQEKIRTAEDPVYAPLADYYLERFTRLRDLWDAIGGDLVAAFRRLEEAGYLDIITVGATHGYLPTIREPAARRAQILVATQEHHRHFGRWPRGIWLPECGYADGVDEILADAGIRYFFVDAHGLLHGRPPPPFGTAAPVFTRAGVAAFARDLESSRQVWSATDGYPGDPDYREFYRDVGFDRPLAEILPFIHPDGIRLHTGFKYQRVTGKVDLADKQAYDPVRARERAQQHAANFIFNRQAQTRHLAAHMTPPPIVISPYDAELFGHWWFEGPMFLDLLCRHVRYQHDLRLATPADYLDQQVSGAVCEISPSSWGEGGYSAVWIHAENDWIYRHQHFAEARMVDLARDHAGASPSPLVVRALNQAARELLLLQSSDWAFILKTQTSVGYARARVEAHIARFRRLDREISTNTVDEIWLGDLESRDNLFPFIDYRVFA